MIKLQTLRQDEPMWVGMPGSLEGGSRWVRVGGHVVAEACIVTEETKLWASQMEGPRAKERGQPWRPGKTRAGILPESLQKEDRPVDT